MKHQGMSPLLLKLGKDARAAKCLFTTLLDDPSMIISSQKKVLIMIQGADPFLQNKHNPALFLENLFIGTPKTFLKCPTFVALSKIKRMFRTQRCFLTETLRKQI